MKYKMAICDDLDADRKYVFNMVNEWASIAGHVIHTDTFVSAENFLFHYAEESDYDILLLDIEMGAMDGIEMAKKIRQENGSVQIIFITGRCNKEFEDPYTLTYDYLKKNKVPYDKLLVNQLDKGKACIEEKIDIYFDDDPKNYESVEKVGIDVYLFTRYSNELLDNFKRVNSIKEIYKIIKKKEKNKV